MGRCLCGLLGATILLAGCAAPGPAAAPGILQHAAQQASASVVHIRTTFPAQTQADNPPATARPTSWRSGGTGVTIGAGLILTDEHVVHDALEIAVCLPDGSWRPVERVVTDRAFDLALLRVTGADLPAIAFSDAYASPGTPVIALGRPAAGTTHCARSGVVTNDAASLQDQLDPARRRDYAYLIESTVRLEPGFSGGPLLDAAGRLIGLNVATSDSTDTGECRGYALPLNKRVRAALARMVAQANQPH
jgi:S1-C subfamily serine protease